MTDTAFTPAESARSRIAPTGDMTSVRGVVHDPTARRMGGVAGHAGLFSTAADLATFCRMILGGGAHRGVRILSPLAVARMTSRATPAEERNVRGLGWDIDSSFSSNRGELLPIGSFGHTGFTGTSLWIDPASGCSWCSSPIACIRTEKGTSRSCAGAWQPSLRPRSCAAASGRADISVHRRGFRTIGIAAGFRTGRPSDPHRDRRASRRRICAAQRQAHRSGDEPYGTRPRRRDDHRSSAQFLDGEGTHAGGIVQPRAWHSRRARRKRAVDDGTRKPDYPSIRCTATHGGRPTRCCKASTRW